MHQIISAYIKLQSIISAYIKLDSPSENGSEEFTNLMGGGEKHLFGK